MEQDNIENFDQEDAEAMGRPAWKSYKDVEDKRMGIGRLDVQYREHKYIEDSIFANWKELYSYAVRLSQDRMTIPSHFRGNPAAIMIVFQKGREIGMQPMDALYSIIPMQGYLCVLGDRLLQMVEESGLVEYIKEEETGSFGKRNFVYKISTKRKDTGHEKTVTFGIEEMKQAKLYIAPSLYDQIKTGLTKAQEIRYRYPQRICKYIALGWLLRDVYPDVLKGLRVKEEVETYDDHEKVIDSTGTVIAGKPMAHVTKSEKRNERLLSTMQIAGELDKDEDGRLKVISEHPDNIVNDKVELFDAEGRIVEKAHYTEDEIYSLKGARSKYLNTILASRGVILDYLPKLSVDNKREIILKHQLGWKDFKLYIAETFGKDASLHYDDMLRKTKTDERNIKTPAKEIEAKPTNKYNIPVPAKHNATAERTIEDALDLKAAIQNYVVDSESTFMASIEHLTNKVTKKPYTGFIDFCRNASSREVNEWLDKMHK